MRKILPIVAIFSWLFMLGCVEDTFMDDASSVKTPEAPSGLTYTPVINAREFTRILSGPPVMNTAGLIPTFEVVEIKDADKNTLDESYTQFVSVIDTSMVVTNLTEDDWFVDASGDTVKQTTSINFQDIGTIVIGDGNTFANGTYYFTVKVTTQDGEQLYSSVFEDVFELQVGPKLATDLLYIPTTQNLLIGQDQKTTEPIVYNANSDIRFELANYKDTLEIDPVTGKISVADNYISISGADEFSPTVNVVSNISEEVVSFDDAITVWVSNFPVYIPKDTVMIYYPTFQAESTLYGYQVEIEELGLVSEPWKRVGATAQTAEDRPDENTAQRMLKLQVNSGTASQPHTSWLIINSQDLSKYELGFNLEAKFYILNQYVEYLPDGTTPSELGIFISTDFSNDFASASWTRVDDQVESIIYDGSGYPEANAFMGLPYPGDQTGVDPDGRKDLTKNADGTWTKCRLDLAPYKSETNVTLAFKFISNFEGEIVFTDGHSRGGSHNVADVHFMAYEQ
ncbi:hypothetical protein N7E81_09330 [Reichenbachiella carrageenanivorans]|uniref:Uncharacterized protein n=1 Tax=Reichenbachiella carrageenanivorans TaxID=2979869 RepID=A0ABY6D574_9BACT|nr:hypothetical protein [Reichenbachiella carrageenanivorans]UXX81291.1 hypothetical protein N7E81_09330 [Reichenbachiella carrageenanivorans]